MLILKRGLASGLIDSPVSKRNGQLAAVSVGTLLETLGGQQIDAHRYQLPRHIRPPLQRHRHTYKECCL